MVKQKTNAQQTNKQYSTSEVLTGDTWIDGRPVYRKVVQATVNATTAGQTIQIGHDITGITNGFVVINSYLYVKIGRAVGNDQNGGQTGGYFEGSGGSSVNQLNITTIGPTYVDIKFGYGAWGNTWCSVVMEYVK